MNYNKSEKEKYRQIWESVDYESSNAVKFAEIVHGIIKEDHWYANIVDLGCGNGATMKKLMEYGYNEVYGIDITLNGIKDISADRLMEAPLWNLLEGVLNKTDWPVPTFTISTDVLEHIPPGEIEQTIKEIIAITVYKTIHAICTRPCVVKHFGHELHLTIKPLSWWQEQFERLNTKGIEVVLMDADKL
jgi:2-polyprenyl-3-methyl-5-hydroxy-6-metoxy-1,4-benzoquinol methylase